MERTIYRVRHPKARNRLPYRVTLYTDRPGGLYSHRVVLQIDGPKTRASVSGAGQSLRECFAEIREQLGLVSRFTMGRNWHKEPIGSTP